MYFKSQNPFGSGCGQPRFYGHRSYSPYEQRQEYDYSTREMAMMEQERRRRAAAAAEFERRRRVEERLAAEEEEYRREKEIERLQRQRAKERKLRQGRHDRSKQRTEKGIVNHLSECSVLYPPGTIVRGPGGRLYRIATPSEHKDENEYLIRHTSGNDESTSNSSCSSTGDGGDNSFDKKPDEPLEFININQITSSKQNEEDSPSKETTSNEELFNVSDISNVSNSFPLQLIPVEDVPDDEDEELRDLHSVWRNRVPSPGQWIEPVESFNAS